MTNVLCNKRNFDSSCKRLAKLYDKSKKKRKVFSTFKNSGLSFSLICAIAKAVKNKEDCNFLTDRQKTIVLNY